MKKDTYIKEWGIKPLGYEEISNREISNREISNKVTSNKETLNKETSNKETLNKETLNKKTKYIKTSCKKLCGLLISILLINLLAGCATAVKHNTDVAESNIEQKQTLPEELDASVSWPNFEDSSVETICYYPEDASQAFPENRQETAAELWQQVQGEFQPVAYQEKAALQGKAASEDTTEAGQAAEQLTEDSVSEGLVLLAQKTLFTGDWSALDALAAPLELTDYDTAYETWFAAMEGYWMDLDYFKRYVRHIYQYNIGTSTFLLLVADSGGTARFVDISCYRLTEDEPEYIDSVTTLDMNARVVPYEGRFYLADTCYNYYSKHNDTIYLYPLTSEGISGQAIEVALLPADYIWTKGYQSDAPALAQINDYVESIQNELMDASPINDNITVFTGCEEPVTDPAKLQRLSDKRDWYMADYDNDGRLEYQARHHWFPSNSTTLYLITEEYRLEDITLELWETWEPECPYRYPNYGYELIQRWYQEFDGQIYTFQLFLTEGYNYYLNVSLWESSKVSWIASYYVTPRCELQVQEMGQETTGKG